MIVVDANVLLRYLGSALVPADREQALFAKSLFEHAERRGEALFVSDAVIAEVVHVLSSPKLYAMERTIVREGIGSLFRFNSFRNPYKQALFDALDLWLAQSSLSFVDALSLSHARLLDAQLATFDRRLAREAGERVWRPSDDSSNGAN